MTTRTIDEVIDRLDDIIATARREQSRAGFFPALYRTVTVEVKEGIAAGRFEDGARMEQLDVVFANRYIEAWDQHRRGARPTRSWLFSFHTAERGQALVLQHLLLGMNAHINLDLGVAAAQTSPGAAFPALQRDFETINDILAGLLDRVQDAVARVSPVFGMLDALALRADEALCNFSMRRARGAAWAAGQELAALPRDGAAAVIDRLDQSAERIARCICHPLLSENPLIARILGAEDGDVGAIIDVLRG